MSISSGPASPVARNRADHAHSSACLLRCPCLRGQVGVVEPRAALWPAALLSRNARAVLVHSSRRGGSGEVAPELSSENSPSTIIGG